MAWLQRQANGCYHISFRFGGHKYKRSLKTDNPRTANSRRIRLEDTIQLIENGLLELPPGVDLPTFLLTEGRKVGKTVVVQCKLSELFAKFFEALPAGALEKSSMKTMRTHCRHIERVAGSGKLTSSLAMSDLQSYVNKRVEERGRRGRQVSATTIRKELASFRSIWAWAVDAGVIEPVPFPSKGLRFPKTTELPPFQTFETVLALTSQLDPDSARARDLWSTVFLNQAEVEELLNAIQRKNHLPRFVYPMFVIAAHTGARRSELLRIKVGDIDEETLTIREKKKRRGVLTTRRIPMSTRTKKSIEEWLQVRPQFPTDDLFCNDDRLRSPNPAGTSVTQFQITRYFNRAVARTKYRNLVGWHVLRHSFCSNCATQGIDQRIIDSWVGHTTDEMRRRYRHLFPNAESAAIKVVCG